MTNLYPETTTIAQAEDVALLRRAIIKAGSQTALADKIGYRRETVWRWWKTKYIPNDRARFALLDYLDTPTPTTP